MIFFLFETLLNSTHGKFFPIKIIHYNVINMAGKHVRPQIQLSVVMSFKKGDLNNPSFRQKRKKYRILTQQSSGKPCSTWL